MINQVNNGTKATNVYDKLKINKPQKTEKNASSSLHVLSVLV